MQQRRGAAGDASLDDLLSNMLMIRVCCAAAHLRRKTHQFCGSSDAGDEDAHAAANGLFHALHTQNLVLPLRQSAT